MDKKNKDCFKNSIIYQILIDRFNGFKSDKNWEKPEFLGGNIKGIIDKLPYLKELGIDVIWISPFYKTNQYHGYHITDFFEVDPHFGNKKDIEKLIQKTHEYDIKIIADFVPNHCSSEHPFFKDAQKNKKNKYKKWFYFTKWPDKYLCFLSINELPKINLDFPEAKEHIIKSAIFWEKLGFDGFRLDHVIGPSNKFWKDFSKRIKKQNPNFILIGEAWMKGIKFNELKTIKVRKKTIKWLIGDSSESLLKEYYNIFDGVLDFKFQEILRDNIAKKNSGKNTKLELSKHYKKYPKDYYLFNFLDNHDMNRFLFECSNDKEKFLKAVKIQFSTNQPIIIYNGTETGLKQDRSIWEFKEHGDIQVRKPMNWHDIDKEIFSFYKSEIKKKKNK